MPNIILITGTPGVGKTRLARFFSKRSGFQVVELKHLRTGKNSYSSYDKARETCVVDEAELHRELTRLSRAEKIVVPTHLVGPGIPKAGVRLAIVLRLDPVMLYQRLRTRGWTKRKAWENTEAEVVGVCLSEAVYRFGPRKVYEINTTRKSVESIYREARKALSGQLSKVGVVDWLAIYDPVELERTV